MQPEIKAVGALNPPPTDEDEEKFESYYDEEDEDEETKLQPIKIGKNTVQQIFSSMSTGQKEQVYSVISTYVENFSDMDQTQGLLEKSRISKQDEAMKVQILQRYNKSGHKFAENFNEEESMAVTCDLLLDIFRHRGIAVLLDVQGMLDEYAAAQKGSQDYKAAQFTAKI